MTAQTELELDPRLRDRAFIGHPKGLGPLFFTELWERFSYYGMRAILVLYMVAPPAQGGLGFDVKRAASIYGWYTMSVYITALPGGLAADYLLGARLAVFLGGLVIAAGHFSMVFQSMTSFYLGMVLIAVGTGLLKPNISAMVGGLYGDNDPRRDSGFSLFYMGINVGAVLAPIVCGYLAQSKSFKETLVNNGFDPNTSWHWGFGAAGVGMILGLIVFVLFGSWLKHVGTRIKKPSVEKASDAAASAPLTSSDWKRIAAIVIFFLFTILFWGAYEQKGASLNLFAKELVRTEAFGVAFPSSYLQSCTPLFVILLSPVFSALWVLLKDRQPSSPVKFYSRTAIHRCCILVDDSGVYVDGEWTNQSAMARWALLPRGLRRDVFESGGTEYGDEARAIEAGRDHDGRLVSGVVVWQQAGGILVRVLCLEQSDAACEVVRRNRGGI